MPLKYVKKAADLVAAPFRWTGRQASGFVGNVREGFGDRDRVLPDFVVKTWKQVKMALPYAFGVRGSATDQVVSSILLAGMSFASSFVTAGATAVLVGVFGLTAFVGVLRWIPAIGDRFDSGRDKAPGGGESSWSVRR